MGPGGEYGRKIAELLFVKAGVPIAKPIRSRGLPKKPRYTDDDVARFAHDYSKAGPSNPRRVLREKYEKRGQFGTDSEIAEWIRRAADRDYLTRAKGAGDRTPRQPTKKLLEWAKANQSKRKEKRR